MESPRGRTVDDTTREMVITAYAETFDEALDAGHDEATAHREGLTGAAMCLAAMSSIDDGLARSMVEAMDLRKLADA
ncbi:hypothetical protein CKO38_16850 [Rhodospirillum rubrum]|nr:hypothetical protein [Rhodospirillum rubrum]MBK1678309.1 hypothetical protein [Rhodospirillum rubrum]